MLLVVFMRNIQVAIDLSAATSQGSAKLFIIGSNKFCKPSVFRIFKLRSDFACLGAWIESVPAPTACRLEMLNDMD